MEDTEDDTEDDKKLTDGQQQPDNATEGNSEKSEQQDGGEKKIFISFESEEAFQNAIDSRLKDRLDREAKKREAAAQKAKEEAEAAALAEQLKFEELADKRAGKITELEGNLTTATGDLETANSQLKRYKTALTQQLEAAKKDLPEATLELLNRLDPVEQLEYLAKHGQSIAPKPNGVPPSPKPAQQKQPGNQDQSIHLNF